MAGGAIGNASYDTVGMMLIGHSGSTLTADVEATSNDLGTMLEAGRVYKMFSDAMYHYRLDAVSGQAATTSYEPNPANFVDWIMPKEDCYLSVIRGGSDDGTLWVTPKYRYGE
jgi:hypothetical protein